MSISQDAPILLLSSLAASHATAKPQDACFHAPRMTQARSTHTLAAALDGQTLDLVAEGLDLAGELAGLVGVDRGGNDGAADAAGAAEQRLAGHVDVRGALVLAQERDVQQDGQGLRVGGQDGNLAGAAVQRLGHLVGALFGLANVRRRLQEVENLLGQGGVGQRPSCRREGLALLNFFFFCFLHFAQMDGGQTYRHSPQTSLQEVDEWKKKER